ncbi:MAG: peptidoglycan-binding protein, partial [Caldimonas sp.]
TTLLLVDNCSGVQIAAAEGTAGNYDFGIFGAALGGGAGGGAGGWSKTPQGKVITAAFADSFNQMVKALRNYQAQTVKGGLGTGGRLGVQGGDTAASKALEPPRPAATKPASTSPTSSTTPRTKSGTTTKSGTATKK